MAQFEDSDIGSWTGIGAIILYQGGFRVRFTSLMHDSNGKTIPAVEHYRPANLQCATGGYSHNSKGARRCTDACVPELAVPYSSAGIEQAGWGTYRYWATQMPAGMIVGLEQTFRFYRYSERKSVLWRTTQRPPAPTPDPYAYQDYAQDGWAAFLQIMWAVSKVAEILSTPKPAKPAPAPTTTLDWLVRYLTARRPDGSPINVMMVGPAGCGKSTIAKLAAERIERSDGTVGVDFYVLPLQRDSVPADIMGSKMPQGGDAPWAFEDTPFTRAFKHGGLILLDEFDAADANTATALHLPLANGHAIIDGKMVERHPDCYVVAACNTYGSGSRVYVGREEIDEATLSRFTPLSVDYDSDYEAGILAQCPDAERQTLTAFRDKIRQAINGGNGRAPLPRTWSTRHMIDWVALINVGIPMAKLASEYFAAWDSNNLRTARDAGVPMLPAQTR